MNVEMPESLRIFLADLTDTKAFSVLVFLDKDPDAIDKMIKAVRKRRSKTFRSMEQIRPLR